MTHERVKHSRTGLLRRALRLEWLTVGWNAVEGIIAVAAALAAGSIALLGFGIDSFVETVSGAVILWRIGAERRSTGAVRIERVEGIARRWVALSLWLLALYVAADSSHALVSGERPSASAVGVILLVVSVAVMKWLANAKRAVALALHSHAMEADAAQTDFCWKLSVVALIGLVANAVLDWWWADPVAALGLSGLIAVEGNRTWKLGIACCE
ncbi:MAG: cation transporter [bacterium]|nr:cation transporter [bacterium]MDE0289694.1 cation transporter [bacterium]MDE0440216.1 cation transporter [bacterium]